MPRFPALAQPVRALGCRFNLFFGKEKLDQKKGNLLRKFQSFSRKKENIGFLPTSGRKAAALPRAVTERSPVQIREAGIRFGAFLVGIIKSA